MAHDLFKDWIPSITEKREYLFSDGVDVAAVEKGYPAYMINRALSQYVDTALQANEMNVSSLLPAKMQYDYLYHTVEKKRRFSKWAKADKEDDVDVVVLMYSVSRAKAIEMVPILGKDRIEKLKEIAQMGGKNK